MTEEQKLERLYVGGLEPPRLKPSEVVERLRLLDGIEIESVDANDKNSFIHLNACALEKSNSAFEIISKSYNNVKWKGCKLKVQIAKPPFLQRLEQERHEREKRQVAILETFQKSTTDPTAISSPALPRHLRIRQGFGLEAWRVDTKPCETMDWDKFDKIFAQLRKRRERKTRTVKDSKTKAFYSRGVRLQFDYKGKNIDIEKLQQNKEQLADPESRAQTDTDTSESEEDNRLDNDINKIEYEWSSNDDTSIENYLSQNEGRHESDSTVSSECAGDNNTISENHQPEMRDVDISSNGDKENAVEDNKDSIKDDAVKTNATAATEQNPSYAWSSDEESCNSEQTEDPLHKQSNLIEEDLNTDDLEHDVASNLGILRGLFPEMKDVTPSEIEKNTEDGSNKSSWKIDNMKRYDPTKESTHVYEVNPDQDENSLPKMVDDDEDSETKNKSSDDDSATSEKSLEDNTKNIIKDNGERAQNVYHESKLEEVFRTARNSGEGGGFQVSSKFGDQPDELKEQELTNGDEKNDDKGSFSFAFDLPSVPAKKNTNATKNDELAEYSSNQGSKGHGEVGKDDSPAHNEEFAQLQKEKPVVQRDRHRGFSPPGRILNQYYKKFFELNDGLSIMEDPQKFRTNEAVKSKWDEERKALTQDWKRKRKYAQVRMQRNNKFRR